ncbi:MAG: hypothetical protein M3P45_06200 [Acidobacteriota bacterium]|nr:hypothetical protein [Acidobacteriota bacterium]
MPTVRKFLSIVFVLAVGAMMPPGARPQSAEEQSAADTRAQSIAEAARRSREQSKNATKPSKVITDDDLDKKNIKPGAQGLTVDAPAKLETTPPTPDTVAAAATTPSASRDATATPAPTDDLEIAKLKESIAVAEKDADLSRRELALEQDTFLSNADHEHDKAGKARLAVLQQEIDAKQQDVDRLKMRLAAMQELHHARPSPAKPAGQPAAPAAPLQP